MTNVALFHSVLGVRQGIVDAADRLRGHGHDVTVVDQYDGRVFDGYDAANAFVEQVGFPALMRRAVDGVAALPDGFVCVGFSNGGGMAEYVASRRPVAGVVLCSGALPLSMIGVPAWPGDVPAQIHYMAGDPFRHPGWAETVAESVRAARGRLEFFEYPGTGHLFTDATLPDEYDPEAAELLWQRVFSFVDQCAPEHS